MDRQMRHWRERYEQFGFRGVFDRRRGKPSPKRVPVVTRQRVLERYRDNTVSVQNLHLQIEPVCWRATWRPAP